MDNQPASGKNVSANHCHAITGLLDSPITKLRMNKINVHIRTFAYNEITPVRAMY
jgi:hypothetical protein